MKRCHSAVSLRTDGKRRCFRHIQDGDLLSPALLMRQLEKLELQIDHRRPFSSLLARSRITYLKQLFGSDAMGITCRQKINIDVRMMSGRVLTNISGLSPSLLMRDLQQRLQADFPDLGDIELVVGQHSVSGNDTLAELVTEPLLMESATPQMTVYVIRRPKPVLHVKQYRPEDFGIFSDDEDGEDSFGRIMIREDIVYAGLDEASTLGKGIAEAIQVHLDNNHGLDKDFLRMCVAIVISNPFKDALKDTCLQALGIDECYGSEAEVRKWEIAESLADCDTTSETGAISMLSLMLENLSGHFVFRVPRNTCPCGSSDISPVIWGGLDVEGNIVGILGNEGGMPCRLFF